MQTSTIFSFFILLFYSTTRTTTTESILQRIRWGCPLSPLFLFLLETRRMVREVRVPFTRPRHGVTRRRK